MRPCEKCGVAGGIHRAGCEVMTPGEPTPRSFPHLNRPRAAAATEIPPDLIRIVRATIGAFAPHRPGAATDGEGIATMLACAAIQGFRVGVDPQDMFEAFKVIVKYTAEELDAEVRP